MTFHWIPLKKPAQVDVSDPLKKYSKNKFPKADHSVAIQEFAQLRKNVVDRCQEKSGGNASTLEVLTSYFDQLNTAEKKLPISENEIRIDFKWNDAFSKDSSRQYSAAFEKASVLFNIAATFSQMACNEASMDGDDHLKAAAKYFQQAAGIFNWLRENPTGYTTNTKADLSSDVLLTLSSLMVAQAQELFYNKASAGKVNEAITSKLAAQTSDFYQQTAQQMKCCNIWPSDWNGTMNSKTHLMHSNAQLHQASVCAKDHKYGEQIARLQYALELLTSAEKAADSSSPLRKFAKEQGPRVKVQIDAAVKDNDFIYHEPIPKQDSLAPIGRATLAKAIVPEMPFNKSERDLFSDMVPLQVAESMVSFEARRDALIQAEVTRLRDATSLLNTILASLSLPAALDEIAGGDSSGGGNMNTSLPTSLLTAAEKIRQAGGVIQMSRDINDIPGLSNRNREIVQECEKMLADEESSDDKLRNEFGAAKWNRTPSSKLNEGMKRDVANNRQTLDAASQADGIVRQKWDAHRPSIEILSKPPAELLAALPSSGQNPSLASKLANNPAVVELGKLMKEVEELKASRENLEVLLKDQSFGNMQETFLEALMRDGAIKEEEISNEKLNERYTSLREQITASLKGQENLVTKVQNAHAKFITERQKVAGGSAVNDPAAQRDKMLGQLHAAATVFGELQNHLEEGKNFYAKMTESLLKLQNSISDFTFARKTEKEDLMLSIQRDAAASGRRANESQQQQQPQHSSPSVPNAPPQVPPQPSQYYGHHHQQQQQQQQPPQGYLPYPVQPPPTSQAPGQQPYWPPQPSYNQTWAPGQQPPYQQPYGQPYGQPYPPQQQPGQNPYYPQYFPPPR